MWVLVELNSSSGQCPKEQVQQIFVMQFSFNLVRPCCTAFKFLQPIPVHFHQASDWPHSTVCDNCILTPLSGTLHQTFISTSCRLIWFCGIKPWTHTHLQHPTTLAATCSTFWTLDHSLSSAMDSNHANHTVQVSSLVVNGGTSLPDFGALHLLQEKVLSNVSVSLSTSLSLDSLIPMQMMGMMMKVTVFDKPSSLVALPLQPCKTACFYDCLFSLHLHYSLPHYFWLLASDRQPQGSGIGELASPDKLFSDIALHFLH